MTELYLIRHAAYSFKDGDAPDDPGLSQEGVFQAERLRDRLLLSQEIKADLVVSSTLQRARQTAEIIKAVFKLPIVFMDEFQEWHNVDGVTISGEIFLQEILALAPEQRPFYATSPELESWLDFSKRVCSAFERLVMANQGKKIVIFCHGNVIEASFLYCFGLSPFQPYPVMMNLDPANTSITHWRKISRPDFKAWRLLGYNDCLHLRPEFRL